MRLKERVGAVHLGGDKSPIFIDIDIYADGPTEEPCILRVPYSPLVLILGLVKGVRNAVSLKENFNFDRACSGVEFTADQYSNFL